MAEKPKISFKLASPGSRPQIQFPDPYEALQGRYDFQTKIIIAIFAIALITLLIMVGTLLLDTIHFNSAVYKEYSDKTQSLQILMDSNKILLENNQVNQKLILDQQNIIMGSLKRQ